MAAPPPNYICTALVRRSDEIIITGKRSRKPDGHTVDGQGTKRNMNQVLLATWNVRGLNNKETEILNEMKRKKANIMVLTETKKKIKGTQDIDDYLLIYQGVERHQRA